MALYRKYRPSTFAEVVGQEQVTAPLSAALDAGRINHAYLFSGPRGCGKTSSARIMARSLNCVEGPTSTPCGTCDSCVSLAPGGPGNLDVTELDAASHNGVDDMRELRDRAYYAPAESRYRIFIIDEAHMISNAGSNALLKVVEEPPEHLIFIFATTEPDKVIGTIRSRTHHYPFRLLTPPAMRGLLERTVAAEDVRVEDSVYPMVIQAGGGSPRDTLSILDQLLAGAGEQGLTYDLARPLLGVTDLSLIDATVDALAAHDKAKLFKLIDDVIEAGHEPKRFAVDLLDRLRDLMVLQVVPDAISAGLVDAHTDRAEVLHAEAKHFPAGHLAHLAAVVNEQIGHLRGATSPRLLLEIMCANLIIDTPSAASAAGVPAASGAASAPSPASAAGPVGAPAGGPAVPNSAPGTSPGQGIGQGAGQSGGQGGGQDGQSGAAAAAAAAAAIAARRGQKNKAQQNQPAQQNQQQPQAPTVRESDSRQPQASERPTERQTEQPTGQPTEQPAQGGNVEELVDKIRGDWGRLREGIGRRNKVAEIMLTEARVLGMRDGTLVLGHTTGALAARINAEPINSDVIEAIRAETGATVKVECIVGTDPTAAGFAAAPQPKPTWNPENKQRESRASDDEEAERSALAPNSSAPEQKVSEQEAPAQDFAEESPAQEAPELVESGWGEPRSIGRQVSQNEAPSEPVARPEAKATAGESEKPGWRERIAQVQQSNQRREEELARSGTFSDGVPVPPEPYDDGPGEGDDAYGDVPPAPGPEAEQEPEVGPEPGPQVEPEVGQEAEPEADWAAGGADEPEPDTALAAAADGSEPVGQEEALSREEEERMMAEEAQNQGERDRRGAIEVAMELLTEQLGARRL